MGPRAARVDEVVCDTIDDGSKEYEGFELEW
jgi:hypothetical protein